MPALDVEDLAVDFARTNLVTMNMAGRFTGREIRRFGQDVIKAILEEKEVGLFFGQQINFKPSLPKNFEYVGGNKAFICYNRKVFRACDERQYRHFLRDLHLRGQMPHHYLPDGNYVVSKLRYTQRPWTEFIAISWVTDERQTKVKNAGHLKKVINYANNLSDAEDMPVIIGGTFRMSLDEIKAQVEGPALRCYGYTPIKARRKMRMCDMFICSKPLKLTEVRPLVCSKLEVESVNTARWVNPEDVFFWDPVMAEVLMPCSITPTPSIPSPTLSRSSSVASRVSSSTAKLLSNGTSPIFGSPRHSNHSSASPERPSAFPLPMAPVPPRRHLATSLPSLDDDSSPESSPSTRSGDDCSPMCISTPDIAIQNNGLAAIEEVSSAWEAEPEDLAPRKDRNMLLRQEFSFGRFSTIDAEREDKVFEMLEAMMSDKNSKFYTRGDSLDTIDPQLLKELHDKLAQQSREDPAFASFDEGDFRQAVPPDRCDVGDASMNQKNNNNHVDHDGNNHVDHGEECEIESACSVKRAQSYQELYDEELIETSQQCYMS